MPIEEDVRVHIGLRLVHSTARHFAGTAVEREDLVGAGMVAVAEALRRAPEVPAFVSYAAIRIDGAMREEYRKAVGLLSRDERRLARRISHAADQFRTEQGRDPEAAELSLRTGISADVVEQIRIAVERHSGWDSSRPAGDLERSGTADIPPSLYPHQLQRAMAQLPRRLRTIIVMRFFYDRTEKAIGRHFGVTESRASQLIRDAIRALRVQLGVGRDERKPAKARAAVVRQPVAAKVTPLPAPPPAKPTRYKVLCISMYLDDIDRADAMVKALKARGLTTANRSSLIRIALAALDIDSVPLGLAAE